MRSGADRQPDISSGVALEVVNIGILAHVDAGKTSLSERLLFECDAIPTLGSVEQGSTLTDSDELEIARGITIRSSVAAFERAGRQYNVVDTPGHTDFVAEVQRALSVLDAAVLVVSAVDGVQAQTRMLMRVLREMHVPTVLMVNKIDAKGARGDGLVQALQRDLDLRVVPMGTVVGEGSPAADFRSALDQSGGWPACADVLAEQDDDLLAALVDDAAQPGTHVRRALRLQTQAMTVFPVVFGSALTGAGVEALLTVLDAAVGPLPTEPTARGVVFALQHDSTGTRTAMVRSFGGAMRARDRVAVRRAHGDIDHRKLKSVEVVRPGGTAPGALTGGHIAHVGGIVDLRVGDVIGTDLGQAPECHGEGFPEPGLLIEVRPSDPSKRSVVHAALMTLADEDPLIRTALGNDGSSEVHLYGEVQREVIESTLLSRFGVEAVFDEPSIIHLERPVGTGHAVEMIGHGFLATVGLRVEPGTGYSYAREVELGSMALSFHEAVEQTVVEALKQGCHGWPVVDVRVTLTHSGFWPRPYSAAGDYRDATPHVLMQALAQATTAVYEPLHRFWLDLPADRLGAATGLLAQHGASLHDTRPRDSTWVVEGRLPLREVNAVQRELTAMTNGLAGWASYPDGDQLAQQDPPPSRPRTDGNPFDRTEYLRYLSRR